MAPRRLVIWFLLLAAAFLVVGVLVWQGVTAHGSPDPGEAGLSPTTRLLYIAVLVFREGLESILVLAAIIASMVGSLQPHRRPVVIGAGWGFLATLVTWFLAVRIVSELTEHLPALNVQAATGLLAVIVLLLVMNWFFHKVYWAGWISMQARKKRHLLEGAAADRVSTSRLLWGLGLLGFASLYREGFEVVLFLQSYYLRLGGWPVLGGVLLGLLLTGAVAVLTFVAHHRLPYRKMLILTGVLLGGVLLVMVGEQAQEMQLARWIPTTRIPQLIPLIPDWMGLWFAVFPTWETLAAQVLAAALVLGSYLVARGRARGLGRTLPSGG
jgi:high-affinity iron transporter